METQKMGGHEKASPYEKIKLLSLPEKGSTTGQVMADLEQLDFSGKLLDSEYPAGDINYNDGKDKKSNPFHKLSKFYGRNKDVFQFVEALRDEKVRVLIMNRVSEKSGNDPKIVSQFGKNMETFLKRVERGEMEAKEFLEDAELSAFFNGYHVNHPGHPRNIHENLNMNVTTEKKTLGISDYFKKITPHMTTEGSVFKRAKIFANGQRVITVIKEDGVKNYTFNKHAGMELEIGWPAQDKSERDVFCVVTLEVLNGKPVLKSVAVDGGEGSETMSVAELAKQNESVLIKGKKLHHVLEKLVVDCVKKATVEMASLIQSKKEVAKTEEPIKSRETLRIILVPNMAPNGEQGILEDFEKLEFTPGPFSAKDEINFNDGLGANPFDKIAKVYGRHKDVFLFNAMLNDDAKRAAILEIAEKKCEGLENKYDLLHKFQKRLEIYLHRISGGAADSKEIIGEGVEGFFHGCYVAKKGQRRNPHQNLNVNLNRPGQVLNTGSLFVKKTARIEAENGCLERVKIYGNGQRILNLVKGEYEQRNYSYSKLANVELDVEWLAKKDVACRLVLEMKGGQLNARLSAINGVLVDPLQLIELARQNEEVLIRGKSLAKVLEEAVGNLCVSQETLIVGHQSGASRPIIQAYAEVLDDFEKLDFSQGSFEPNDKLNWNDGLEAHPFEKIRKLYGRDKNIFLFISAIQDPGQLEKICDIVKRKCGDYTKAILEFERKVNVFLERVELGRNHAKMFLGEEESRAVDALFAGYHFPGGKEQRRNIHANLNIDLIGEAAKGFDVADYFKRKTPHFKEEKGELQNVKLFGNGKRLLKVSKLDGEKKNYIYSKWAENMKLEICWKTDKAGESSVVLNIHQGNITAPKLTPELVELSKQNNMVLLRGKRLHDVLQHCLDSNKTTHQEVPENIPAANAKDGKAEVTDFDDYIILGNDDFSPGNAALEEKKSSNAEDSDGDDWIDNAPLE